ncbi:CmcI family methyltransferase [Roseivirga pacifica]|uniref:CmcI family methyltransferase n=1 Tax=Roseivirga pacifica TaxID=1267423 RepID=UPI003BAD78A8
MSLLKKVFNQFRSANVNSDIVFQTNLKLIEKAHHQTSYRGVTMVKCPFDLVLYQMIISEVCPDLIIEIGTKKGGSALYFADLLRNIGCGEVHTIDIEQAVDEKVLKAKNITLFEGGWQNYLLENCQGFKRIMVIDDGSHVYDEVLAAFEKFNKLVSVGSYYIIEDGIIDQLNIKKAWYNGGPLKASLDILDKEPSFVLDKKYNDFFGPNATFNPLGYLKRV